MKRTLSLTLVTVALALVGAPTASADQRIASYCSPTGDYCQGVFRTTGGSYYFDLRTFSFRGSVQVCVSRRTRVCRSRALTPVGQGVYQARIFWAGNYPNQGVGRYAVTWYWAGNRIGRTLSFFRRPAVALNCGLVSFKPGPDYEGSVRILRATEIGCVAARGVVRSCGYRQTVPGWRVVGNAVQFTLISGSRRILVRGVAGGAPRCAPAP